MSLSASAFDSIFQHQAPVYFSLTPFLSYVMNSILNKSQKLSYKFFSVTNQTLAQTPSKVTLTQRAVWRGGVSGVRLKQGRQIQGDTKDKNEHYRAQTLLTVQD